MSYPQLPTNGETNWGNKIRTWADALEGRKVEAVGTAMALSRSTTVGTRVFLEHPGGNVMLYGDTGWRDISSLLHEEWETPTAAGQFLITRQNDTVTLAARIQRAEGSPPRWLGENVPLLNTEGTRLPDGFGPIRVYGGYATLMLLSEHAGHLAGNNHGDELQVRARSAPNDIRWVAGNILSFETSWTTRQTWPTALPGTP